MKGKRRIISMQVHSQALQGAPECGRRAAHTLDRGMWGP